MTFQTLCIQEVSRSKKAVAWRDWVNLPRYTFPQWNNVMGADTVVWGPIFVSEFEMVRPLRVPVRHMMLISSPLLSLLLPAVALTATLIHRDEVLWKLRSSLGLILGGATVAHCDVDDKTITTQPLVFVFLFQICLDEKSETVIHDLHEQMRPSVRQLVISISFFGYS